MLNRGHVIVVDRRSKAIEQQQMQEVRPGGIKAKAGVLYRTRGVMQLIGPCNVWD